MGPSPGLAGSTGRELAGSRRLAALWAGQAGLSGPQRGAQSLAGLLGRQRDVLVLSVLQRAVVLLELQWAGRV